MSSTKWMIYGAYGFTGELLARKAVDEGFTPIVAGRSAEKLQGLKEELDLNHRVFSLDDFSELTESIQDVETVVHCAGPFVKTAEPMMEACVETGTNYLDITGEIPVFETEFEYDEQARDAGCAIISGMGFDVVPTDCLARYVANKVESPDSLEIVVRTDISPSSGTMKTMLELSPEGGFLRRNGSLRPAKIGGESIAVDFPGGSYTGVSIPLGDLVTASRSTGAPNITTYLTVPSYAAPFMGIFSSFLGGLTRVGAIRRTLQWIVEKTVSGPTEEEQKQGENWIYARVKEEGSDTEEAWLRAPEAYRLTVLSCLEGVKKLPDRDLAGSFAPAEAFGADFVLGIEGTERFDRLPASPG